MNRVLLVVVAVIVGCLVNMPQMKLKDPMMKAGAFAVCLYLSYTFLNSQGLIEANWLDKSVAKLVRAHPDTLGRLYKNNVPFAKDGDAQRVIDIELANYCHNSEVSHDAMKPANGQCKPGDTLHAQRVGNCAEDHRGCAAYCLSKEPNSKKVQACIARRTTGGPLRRWR